MYDPHVRLWLDAFLDRWLAATQPASAQPAG
jgi:hypothetical protein